MHARALTLTALLLAAAPASAQIYKCPDAGGRTVFQQVPCTGGSKLDVQATNGTTQTDLQAAFEAAHQARMKVLAQTNADCDARGVKELVLGMNQDDAMCVTGWRFPKTTNTTQTAGGVRQQVVYGGFDKYDDPPKYLYFENGKLTAIQK